MARDLESSTRPLCAVPGCGNRAATKGLRRGVMRYGRFCNKHRFDEEAKIKAPLKIRLDGKPYGAPRRMTLPLPPMPTAIPDPFTVKVQVNRHKILETRVPYPIMRAMYALGPDATLQQLAAVGRGLSRAELEQCQWALFHADPTERYRI